MTTGPGTFERMRGGKRRCGELWEWHVSYVKWRGHQLIASYLWTSSHFQVSCALLFKSVWFSSFCTSHAVLYRCHHCLWVCAPDMVRAGLEKSFKNYHVFENSLKMFFLLEMSLDFIQKYLNIIWNALNAWDCSKITSFWHHVKRLKGWRGNLDM